MQQELKQLIERLTPELLTSLESAAADCAGRGHRTVEIEHWLWQLISQGTRGFAVVEGQFGLDRGRMVEDLEQRLDRLERGHEGAPALASNLVALMQDAWVAASLNAGQSQIHMPHLLLALINREAFMLVSTPLTEELRKLSRETLQSLGQEPEKAESGDIPAAQVTAALDKYTHNLTAQAAAGEIDPISGRQDEIRQMIDILSRRRQNNPILVGDPGVGKTAVVEGLAQSMFDGEVPDNLKGVELRILDLSLLQAGASIKGEFEKRLQDVINEVQSSATPIILFIDEAHTLIGAGGAAGQNDAANLLKPALARGELRTIAATTWAEYKKYFESDAALTRRFQVVKVPEPGEEDAIAMVRGVVKSLSAHHGVRVVDAAVEAAVKLSVRYLPERQLPDKAISLLDTACSRVGLSVRATPEAINRLLQKQRYLQQEQEALSHEWSAGDQHQQRLADVKQELEDIVVELSNLEARWTKEKALAERIQQISRSFDEQFRQARAEAGCGKVQYQPDADKAGELQLLQDELRQIQGEKPMVKPLVDDQSIAQVIESWTGIPAGNMIADETRRLLALEEKLSERVIGQKMAIDAISEAIRINRTGLGDNRRPMGVFLMCGPSGVGKTETALALADQLFGGEQNLTVINMTEFKEEHKVSMLLGAPAGYVGYGEGGVLTEAVRRKPHSILLLDEMEKAHPGVHDIFYQIFDKGRISDSAGQEVDFRNTLIIMTSNAADFAICDSVDARRGKGAGEKAEGNIEYNDIMGDIQDELLNYFKPAFLGRTHVVPYLPLSIEEMKCICRISLNRIRKNITEKYQAEFEVDDNALEQLVLWNNSPHTGARAIEQIINRKLMPQLARECLLRTSSGEEIRHIRVEIDNQELAIAIS
ncbi:type VI secretion system ATPase TssH [Sansalvadorimonas sp. 2012CJ34-2]|uniref:Type VI secretion system ATPase TssH n=1 Tax=Parendozoicomonas callyspongiae TaxID=2942213 RepID=A0ABT0PL35_9GAMM|nr:type VI secretion system ATPase TssH [Sansalvadorimonas sp. 2012CJ34-2]MCL6271447.1 type VI secretion system ATPase TssH [Sansalvadorimonas sp. 2012CJ34-2]